MKNKENLYVIKEKLLRLLYAAINKENKIEVSNNAGYLRFYIGYGNNPHIVKSVLKQRWWWTIIDSIENAHLVWTPWKKGNIISSLSVLHPSKHYSKENSLSTTSADNQPDNNKFSAQGKTIRLCNHLEGNAQLGNKKALYYNMKNYYNALNRDPFITIPLTYHIKMIKDDLEYKAFKEYYKLNEGDMTDNHGKTIWIVKPGENSNRGNGISLCNSLEEIDKLLNETQPNCTKIIQKYIEKPLLYNKRKFDIRCYCLVTAINGFVKGYFYKEGYLRTASKEFNLKNLGSKAIHLTNEAVQRKFEDFSKFEPGNKLTYGDLQKYFETTPSYADIDIDFPEHILPQIKKLVTDSLRAVHGKLDPNGRMHALKFLDMIL